MASRVPALLPPQLCTPAPLAPGGSEWLHELKYDGWRLLARKDRKDVRLYTRGGHDWSDRLPAIVDAVRALRIRSGWLDGELVRLDASGFPDFEALQRAIRRRDQRSLFLQLFDAPWLDGRDMTRQPLVERKMRLEHLLNGAATRLRYSAHVIGDGATFFRAVDGLGAEGIVSKRLDSRYRPGERAREWLKVKCWRTYTVVVGGIERDADGRIAALLVGTREAAGLRYAGRVELGLGRVHALWPAWRAGATPHAPFDGEWRTRRRTWIEPRYSIVVRALPRVEGRPLRHAIFERAA